MLGQRGRIDQARANTRIAGAPLLPNVEATGSLSGTHTHQDHRTRNAGNGQAALTVNYEVDLWGKNAAALESAEHTLTANVFDRDALALTIQSEVAATYFDAVALKQRIEIARANLDAANQVLKLVQIQMNQGAATALDLAQQRTAVRRDRAAVECANNRATLDGSQIERILDTLCRHRGVFRSRRKSLRHNHFR